MASFLLLATRGGKILWVSLAGDEQNLDKLDNSNNSSIEKTHDIGPVVKVVDTFTPQVLGIEVSLALNCAVMSCVSGLRYLKVGRRVTICTIILSH